MVNDSIKLASEEPPDVLLERTADIVAGRKVGHRASLERHWICRPIIGRTVRNAADPCAQLVGIQTSDSVGCHPSRTAAKTLGARW